MTEEYVVAQMRTIISAAYETVSAVIAVRSASPGLLVP